MSINRTCRVVIASSIVLAALSNHLHADAKGWQQWVQQGSSIIKRGVQMRNQAAGGYEGYHQAPQTQSPPESSSGGSPNSPGSNYYNIDPSTMRNPLRHATPEPPAEQPSYTPPSYQRSYSSRSAYHTGSDAPPDNQSGGYSPATKTRLRARAVVKHLEKPERAAVAVVHVPTKPLEKPEFLKPATTFDTSWIIPTVDRLEAKLRKG